MTDRWMNKYYDRQLYEEYLVQYGDDKYLESPYDVISMGKDMPSPK